jgi:NADPH-dependent 2,4-dienoyl-CoA reductase/sulfur reductase-like enzyme
MSPIEIIDFKKLSGDLPFFRCQVCIVGAGAAGLYLGTDLPRRRFSVVIVEAGGHGTVSGCDVNTP